MKKITVAFVSLITLIFVLVGCGNNEIVENAGEELVVYSMDDLKTYSASGKTIKVKFWHSFGQAISKELDILIEKFEDEMDKIGVKVDIVAESTGGGYNGLRSRINQGIKSKAIPTMALGYPDHFADYITNDIMLSLDSFINSKDPDMGMSQTERDDYVASYWNENIFKINGTDSVVGIPFNKSSEVMYYNASAVDPILAELGYLKKITDENGKVTNVWEKPTWEQLWAVNQKLLDKHKAGTLNWNYKNATYSSNSNTKYPTIIDSASNFFITTSRQWGGEGKYTRLGANGKGEIVFDNADVKAAQAYFLDKANKNLWQLPEKLNQSFGSNLMVNLQSYISVGSTAGIKNNDSAKYELKVTSYPQKSYAENEFNAAIQQGTNACILSANSNNYTRAVSWLLIKYLTNVENTSNFSIATGYLPVRTSALESEAYQDFLNSPDDIFTGSVAQAIQSAYNQQNYFFTDPAFSGSSIVRDKIGEGVISIYCQNQTVDSAINYLYTELKKLKFNCISI